MAASSIAQMLIYVVCSASGLVLMKFGMSNGFLLSISDGVLHLNASIITFAGVSLYLVSFLLSLVVMSKLSISFFYPLSAGLIYILVSVFGALLLKEKLDQKQVIGMAFILVGIIIMNFQK